MSKFNNIKKFKRKIILKNASEKEQLRLSQTLNKHEHTKNQSIELKLAFENTDKLDNNKVRSERLL